MAKTLSDIRFLIEREVKATLEDADVLNWSNQVNADIGMKINLPATTTITLNTTDLQYALPADLKIINRLRLQSVIDEGLDREFQTNYRIYNGYIILPRVLWIAPDDLVVDYYKHLSTFSDIDDEIQLDDRYAPVYQFYGLMKYYDLPDVVAQLGAQTAMRKMQSSEVRYTGMKNQLTAYQSLSNEPVVLDGRW